LWIVETTDFERFACSSKSYTPGTGSLLLRPQLQQRHRKTHIIEQRIDSITMY
jgi:hypothetical protein